ncbi:unnamed protein product [marine sediment metagenome]|uniref:Uncharacterized protein n=1 Tax=marine sediment metagenome TaxID=412755 RepID=X0TGC7_9ZZZZ
MNTGIYGILELEQKVDIMQLVKDLHIIEKECLRRIWTPNWNDLMPTLMKNQIKV